MPWKERLQKVLTDHKFDVELKTEQIQIISAIMEGKDVFAQLPTGYGKSLIYTLLPLLMDEINPRNKHTILVISPLRALMINQVHSLGEHDVRATALLDSSPQDIEGSSIIFASPEAALLPKWKRLIRRTTISAVVFDEAHCISQWGLDFRPDYRKVSTLPIWLSAPTLVLTATEKIQSDVFEVLGLSEETEVVAALPDRPNIFLHTDFVIENFKEALNWLPGHLQSSPSAVKKIIVYVHSINACQQIFNWILDELGENIFCGEKAANNKIAYMFHAHTDEDSKKRIMEHFVSKDGNLKVLISTVAFGMGVNIRDVDMVVHWGVPPSSLSYWQEISSCARNGREGYAICYAYRRSVTNCKEESLKSIMTKENPGCIRENILKRFQLKGIKDSAMLHLSKYRNKSHADCKEMCTCGRCQCCTVCASLCQCKKKIKDRLQYFLEH